MRAPPYGSAFVSATAAAIATAATPSSPRATTLLPPAPQRAAPGRPLAPAAATSPTVTIDLTTADQLEEVKEDECQRLEQLASNHYAVDDEVEADATTPWLVATEWPQQFGGRPLDVIAAFAKSPVAAAVAADSYGIGSFQGTALVSPAQDKARLQQISQVFAHVFNHGIQTLQEAPYQIRCWLKSYSPYEFFPRPFNQLQKPGTRTRYQRQWQCFLCFCFRAWRLDPALRQRLFGPALDLAPYEAQMRQIWDLLEPADLTPLPLPLPLPSELVDRVQELSWQFLTTPIPQHHRHYHYPLLYFVGVLGIHPYNLAYRTPYQFTPILAGLLWVSRLLLLEYS